MRNFALLVLAGACLASQAQAQSVSRAIPPQEVVDAEKIAFPEVREERAGPSGNPIEPVQSAKREMVAVHEPESARSEPSPRSSDKLVRCVAQAVYHEARGESVRGQQAVADVVANRARSGRWGDHCGVVNAPRQFSGRSGWSAPRPGNPAWDKALEIARKTVSGSIIVSRRFMNFRHVSMGGPNGSTVIGRHIFW